MRLTTITSLAAMAVVAVTSAASASTPDEPVPGPPPGELIASLTTQGLFPVSAPFLANSPTVAVYDDGTVLARHPSLRVIPDVPNFLVDSYVRVTVSDAEVDRLVDAAEELGLTETAPDYPPNLSIVDAPRTWLVVGAGEQRQVHVVDGLVDDEADAQRAAVADFAAQLQAIADDAIVDPSSVYEPPSALAVQAAPAQPRPTSTTFDSIGPPYPPPDPVAWPDATVTLADATDCVIIDDPDTVDLLNNSVIDSTFIDAGVTYAVAVKVVLPGHGCRPSDPPPTATR